MNASLSRGTFEGAGEQLMFEYECLKCGWFTFHQVNDEF